MIVDIFLFYSNFTAVFRWYAVTCSCSASIADGRIQLAVEHNTIQIRVRK
jgi:hypothetical protein